MSDNYLCDFGFDLGIGSIGTAVIADKKLLYSGVRIFNQAKEAKESRLHRSARRNLSRKKWRKTQLKKAFSDFGIISAKDFEIPYFSSFTAKSNSFETPKDRTVYHLRKRALSEKISARELYLCLLNMLHARGHFNMEMYDFNKNTISFGNYKQAFYEMTKPYFTVFENEKDDFENTVLMNVFNGTAKKATISLVKKNRYVDEEETDALYETLILLINQKAKVRKIDESFAEDEKKGMNIKDLRSMEEDTNTFFEQVLDLVDLAKTSQIMKEYSYLCEKAVVEIDGYEKVIKESGINSEEFQNLKKEIAGKASSKATHSRSWRNLENNYPNGMYVKEAAAILRKQQEFYTDIISNEFIEVCKSIISARIPYYIGPLSITGKNAWIKMPVDTKFKYSYAYTLKQSGGQSVDIAKSIEAWKERMISHCTYFPDEPALPKGSFMAETFNILNEMNILHAESQSGDTYYLTQEDKIKIFDKLFLNQGKVTYKEVAELLNLKSFGPKKSGTKEPEFNNTYTLYLQICKFDPTLKLDGIMDLFDNIEIIEKIENLVLLINLFSEEKSREEQLIQIGYASDIAKKLAKLSSNSYYSFSRKYIFETIIDKEGNSFLSKLFEDNTSEYVNEQMTLTNNAVDINGNPLNFISNKYLRKIKDNNGELDINLLIDNGKPVIPMSRPVVRSLNECMKVYSELVKVYGVPKRVVFETARDFKDHTEIPQKPEKHFKTVEKLYEHVKNQLKEKKLYETGIDDLGDMSEFLSKNSFKMELYLRQNGYDLLTGEPINLNKLNEYEVDHILPRGFGDDSKDDKILISRLANARKGDRLPLEFLSSGETIGKVSTTTSQYEKRVQDLFNAGLISEQKYKRLLLQNTDELDRFINQNLVDTRYIIREFMSILNAYNDIHGYNTHLVALKSAYTSVYRKAFNMKKVREYGDQHHAHDAALLLIADKTLSHMYPGYDRKKSLSADKSDSFKTYAGFIEQMNEAHKKSEGTKIDDKSLNSFINYAYYKTFNESASLPGSLLSQIKKEVPFYSVKVEKNFRGQYFEATIHKQKENDPKKPLSIIGVNDETKVFSGVECAAVDFYKFKNKKGKREHLAVHIPKVIIHQDGTIDQNKYLDLIRYHYKKPELIGEDGRLKTECFRFRAFRNDIIYDTVSYCPRLFNIGSIANSKLEMKFLNIHSYDDIYSHGYELAGKLIKKFNIKNKSNPNGVSFSEIDFTNIIEYVNESIWERKMDEGHLQTIHQTIQKTRNIYELSDALSFYEYYSSLPDVPPTITGQFTPTINSRTITQDQNAQYIKLKYNILGLRFLTSINGKLIIESPYKIQGAYTRIRKEEFSWSISQNNV